MQTQTLSVWQSMQPLPQDTPRTARWTIFGPDSLDVLSDFYLMREKGVGAAQILQRSGLTSKDLLTYSTCCCLLVLLQTPVLLLTGAPCEWDVAAFGDDLYMCEINHFTRPNSVSVGEEKCIFINRLEKLSSVFCFFCVPPMPHPSGLQVSSSDENKK